jgi:hypothetical protein
MFLLWNNFYFHSENSADTPDELHSALHTLQVSDVVGIVDIYL